MEERATNRKAWISPPPPDPRAKGTPAKRGKGACPARSRPNLKGRTGAGSPAGPGAGSGRPRPESGAGRPGRRPVPRGAASAPPAGGSPEWGAKARTGRMTDECGRRVSPDRAIHAGMRPLNHKKVGVQSPMPRCLRSASSTMAPAKYDTVLSGLFLLAVRHRLEQCRMHGVAHAAGGNFTARHSSVDRIWSGGCSRRACMRPALAGPSGVFCPAFAHRAPVPSGRPAKLPSPASGGCTTTHHFSAASRDAKRP